VQNCSEVLLEINAFAEAISGDQDAGAVTSHIGDSLLAEVIGQLAGYHLQIKLGNLLCQAWGKVLAEVIGSLDIAAKDYRLEALGDPVLEDDRGGIEFLVSIDVG
jgi:hypothetical protein